MTGCRPAEEGLDAMRVPLIATLALSLAVFLAAGSVPPRLPIAMEVVALDTATYAQGRYVEGLVARAGRPSAWFEYQPSRLERRDLEDCAGSSVREAETCVRRLLARQELGNVRPAHVVVLIAPGEEDKVVARCIGIGGQPHSGERQSTTLDPGSLRYAGNAQYDRDLGLMAGCITAAGAESGW